MHFLLASIIQRNISVFVAEAASDNRIDRNHGMPAICMASRRKLKEEKNVNLFSTILKRKGVSRRARRVVYCFRTLQSISSANVRSRQLKQHVLRHSNSINRKTTVPFLISKGLLKHVHKSPLCNRTRHLNQNSQPTTRVAQLRSSDR